MSKHGHTCKGKTSRTYSAWTNMHTRCSNVKSKDYHRYGGRGICVCKKWASFKSFLLDMGEVKKGLTLDRIDNNGNYEHGNCRWATRNEQARNTNFTHNLTDGAEVKCLTDWAVKIGICRSAIRFRLKNGWPVKEAVTTPKYGKARCHYVRRGEDIKSARLNENLVCAIRKLYKRGVRGTFISMWLGFPKPTIFDVIWGKTWKHVLSEPLLEGSRAPETSPQP